MTVLIKHGVTPRNGLVCLAGFMRIISPQFVKKYKNRMINIHPALLPAFPGLDSQKQALEHGAKFSGCTVHFVDADMDSGPIIIQAVVKIRENDTLESLSKRILKEEHRIYPEAVNLFARKKIRVSGRKTIIS
jgi:phosphoribosylglycinamide formyltransferase-1